MFFEQEQLNAHVLDVVMVNQLNSDSYNRRGFHALSLRLEADTTLSFGGRTLRAGAGTVGYFPAGLSYRRRSLRDRMIVIHFSLDQFYASAIELFTPGDPERYRPLFEEALALWRGGAPGARYRVTAIFYTLLAMIREEQGALSPICPPVLRPVLDEIDAHFTDPSLCVASLARRCHLSEAYLRRLFREFFGMPPHRYLMGKRINHAVALLESRLLSVREVAEQAGFSDPKYFSNVFRAAVGVSPGKYLYHWNEKE
ncbi:MAG: helix-turn-helix transcriptional regulator [Clostridia bacterium]|nr:helix-turn-helix transcriptional regulator [Clostridia bacterium]